MTCFNSTELECKLAKLLVLYIFSFFCLIHSLGIPLLATDSSLVMWGTKSGSKEIFKDEIIALLSAAVISLDGLALVMSRIGMNDSYFLVFALLSIYFFIKDKNLVSAIFLGLAASSKWTTMWVLPILFVAHFVFKVKKENPAR